MTRPRWCPRLFRCESVGAIPSLSQKAFVNKGIQHALAVRDGKLKEAGRLRQRWREAGHLLELAANPFHDR
jgi:hypothetical protein